MTLPDRTPNLYGMSQDDSNAIGAAALRLEDGRFLTGRGRFTGDLAPQGALEVVFLRSPHAHARIVQIDTGLARAAPGVVAVFTGTDVTADGLGHIPAISEIKDRHGNRHREPRRLPISADRIRHVGEIVAMVVADSLNGARGAAEQIAVEYETLAAVVSADAALAAGAPELHADAPGNLMCDWVRGDAAA